MTGQSTGRMRCMFGIESEINLIENDVLETDLVKNDVVETDSAQQDVLETDVAQQAKQPRSAR